MSANSPSSVKRSSVVDRVRWIEKTHGPANNAGQQPPRARLRLPKNFAEMQQQKISEADGPREPATAAAAAAGLVQESSLRLPKLGPRKAQQQNQQQPSPPPPVAEESPSPVLSEASTAIAPLVSSKEMAGAKERSEKALAAAAASATVVSAATAAANAGHLRSVSEASSASSDSLALAEGARTIINAAEEGDECFYSNRDCASSASDLEPADPVHVSESQLQQMQQMQKPRMKSSVTIVAPAGGRSQRRQQKQQNGFKSASAASPRPAAGGGSAADEAKKSLGGIRSRMRPMSSRRYNKTADQQSQSQSQNQNQGQPRHSPPMSPDLRASKSLTNLVLGSPDYDDDDDDEDDENRRNQIQNHHGSLIARLTKLKANRPSAQSLVSNWGAPKFVKRSQFSNTIPVDAKSGRTVAARRQHTVVAPSPAPVPVSFSSYWGRSQKRYK
ncbi:hypothetical protein LPJ72_005337 [Coemansia sp. Benny D160-2]|nr:hypothetical protein LPJ72_005337 [Coemansia sp. Benny D160-2]